MPPSNKTMLQTPVYGSVAVDGDDSDDDSIHQVEALREQLLAKTHAFKQPFNPDQGYKSTAFELTDTSRPHMRAFHASWVCFLLSWFVWFSMSPILTHIQESTFNSDGTPITIQQIGTTNMWSMVGTIVLRIILGPLCDQFGARDILTKLLQICALGLGLSGLLIHEYYSLLFVRFWIGCVGGTLVPAQYWVTCHFVRSVCGRATALATGWGAMGGGLAQVVMGTFVYPFVLNHLADGDANLAWRISLIVPALIAIVVAWWFRNNSDDCPLGNFKEAQQVGLMAERSAVASFRSGVLHINAWILCVQFASGLGIELTMNSCATVHLVHRFGLTVSTAAAYASLFGLMNIFSRGLGGYLSDKAQQYFNLRGRLAVHMSFMLLEGLLILVFIRCESLTITLTVMMAFAIFGQMGMGTCFALVPYVHPPSTGTIAGIVGAGGNLGAVYFLSVMRNQPGPGVDEFPAFVVMAVFTVVAALLTPLVVIKGHRGLIFGSDESSESSEQKSLTAAAVTTTGVNV